MLGNNKKSIKEKSSFTVSFFVFSVESALQLGGKNLFFKANLQTSSACFGNVYTPQMLGIPRIYVFGASSTS